MRHLPRAEADIETAQHVLTGRPKAFLQQAAVPAALRVVPAVREVLPAAALAVPGVPAAVPGVQEVQAAVQEVQAVLVIQIQANRKHQKHLTAPLTQTVQAAIPQTIHQVIQTVLAIQSLNLTILTILKVLPAV